MTAIERCNLLLAPEKTLKFCKVRLETFKDWPKYLRPKPVLLARAGLCYSCMSDRVSCFECKVVLHNWRAWEDPLQEHYKASPNCAYLKICYYSEEEKELASDEDKPYAV